MEEKLQELEVKALAAIEKHLEAMALELADIGKEYADVKVEDAKPIVKLIYGAGVEPAMLAIKELIIKLDLNKDGQ
jgi:hypothetical protein